MKQIIFILSLAVLCFLQPIQLYSQSSTEKVVKKAIKSGKFSVGDIHNKNNYFDWHEEYVYSVSDCNLDEGDFNAFFRMNPRYVVEGKPTKKTKMHFGAKYTNVTSFSFRDTNPETNTLIAGIQIANDNKKLEMPDFHDIHEANTFYVKYVKPHPQLTEKYLQEFAAGYTSYIRGNEERIRAFCADSPYDDEIMLLPAKYAKTERRISPRAVMNSALTDKDYVFYLEKGYGFVYNNQGRYLGDIVDGKAHGKGEWSPVDNGRSIWTGEFRDGKMNGPMTHTLEVRKYNGYYNEDSRNYFHQEEKGNCVDGVWDGDVELTVENRSFSLTCKDVTKYHYDKGVPVSREVLNSSLIDALKSHIGSQNEIEKDFQSGNLRIPRVKKTSSWGDRGFRIVSCSSNHVLTPGR